MIPNLVTTIIPVYNRAKLLSEAVSSVLTQTYQSIEIIIINDGSTDNTAQVANQLAKQYPNKIKVLHIPNGGPGAAREAGRLMAQGEFIQYLDSDDLLLPDKFSLQVEALKEHPECGVAYGKTRFYKRGQIPVNKALKRTGEKIDTMFPSFLLSRWWSTSTPLHRQKILEKAGSWLKLKNEEDWEYDCRIASMGIKLYFVDAFVSDTRIVDDGLHLSADGLPPVEKLKNRAVAHIKILTHAQTAGITTDIPEMQHFSRELFLLARQCGSVGLIKESKQLFKCAKQSATPKRVKDKDFYWYPKIASFIGWKIAGKLSCWRDKLCK